MFVDTSARSTRTVKESHASYEISPLRQSWRFLRQGNRHSLKVATYRLCPSQRSMKEMRPSRIISSGTARRCPTSELIYVTLGRPHKDRKRFHRQCNSSPALDGRQQPRAPVAAISGRTLCARHSSRYRRFFIIIPDDIGHGASSKPSDGLEARFPHYRYGDMVDLQHKLVTETLGIKHLHAIIGMSMGCMNAWQWAEAYPNAMDGIMPIACFPAPISGRNLLWRRMFVLSVKYALANGNFDHQSRPPAVAPALIRMMIDGVPHLQAEVTTPQSADAFIEQVGNNLRARTGIMPSTRLKPSEDFDAEPGLSQIKTKVLRSISPTMNFILTAWEFWSAT